MEQSDIIPEVREAKQNVKRNTTRKFKKGGSEYFDKEKKEARRKKERAVNRKEAFVEFKRLIEEKPELQAANEINYLEAYQAQLEAEANSD